MQMKIRVSHFQAQAPGLEASLYDAKQHNKSGTLEQAMSLSNYFIIFLSSLDRDILDGY